MRVVLDTNIYVSGLFFGGIPRKILDLVEEEFITPCFTIKTFTELERLLYHNKFTRQRNLLSFSIADFLNKLKSYSLIFPQPSKIPIIIKEDLADNYFLACAILSQADFIISAINTSVN
jgi:putative PIN family toxin of toxin-antitoxin system